MSQSHVTAPAPEYVEELRSLSREFANANAQARRARRVAERAANAERAYAAVVRTCSILAEIRVQRIRARAHHGLLAYSLRYLREMREFDAHVPAHEIFVSAKVAKNVGRCFTTVIKDVEAAAVAVPRPRKRAAAVEMAASAA